MSKTIFCGREFFSPEFRPIYEIVRVEQDKIFIIPHVWNNVFYDNPWGGRQPPSVHGLIETYVFHVCKAFDKSIYHVRNGHYKLIFGFANGSIYEWKLVEYKFSHVGKGGGVSAQVYTVMFSKIMKKTFFKNLKSLVFRHRLC